MAIDSTKKSSRLLQSRRYTHDSFTDAQEAFTSVLDINASEIFTDQNLIPTASLPFSGSSQSGSIYTVNGINLLKYYYRYPMTRSNLVSGSANEVWFLLSPSGSVAGIGAQIIDANQQTSFVSPKYASPSLANSTAEDNPAGYLAKVFVSSNASAPSSGDVVSVNNYAFDYKTGVLEFATNALSATTSQYVYITTYQYIGRTLNTSLGSLTGSFSGSFTGSLFGTASQAVSSSYAYTASSAISSSYALSASYLIGGASVITFPYSGSAQITGSLGVTGSISTTGTITAQTLIVQTVTSSIIYSSGSNIFGNSTANTQTFTGSVNITGSLNLIGRGTINDLTGSLFGTASQAISASYALNGGVTQLFAGSNITLSPTNGLGQVTISSTGGGGTNYNTATGSYGSFYDTTIQTNAVANAANSMSFNSTDITNGVSISGSTSPTNTYIKVANAGIYNIQFSTQFDRTNSGTDTVYLWLRKNGVDVAQSNTSLILTGNATTSAIVAAWNFFTTANVGDYYQIMWSSLDTHVRLFATTPAYGPAIPSVILTVNRIDTFLSNTGSFSGSFRGEFTGSLFGTSSQATSASYVLNAVSSSYAYTASSAINAFSASNAVSASYSITSSVAYSGTGSFTGSFFGNGSGLTNISASSINGLNLFLISTGSISASVNVGQNIFTISSASSTVFNLSNSGSITVNATGSVPHFFLITSGSKNVFKVNNEGVVENKVFEGGNVPTPQYGAMYFTSQSVYVGLD